MTACRWTSSTTPRMWRPIPGYDGYEASDRGEVRSWRAYGPLPHVMQGRIGPTGYRVVCVRRPGKRDSLYTPVHKLVTLAFHGSKPTPKHEVRHLDGDKMHNCPHNLRWGTRSENMQDSVRHGTLGALRRPTHCKHGHELTDENVHVRERNGSVKRECRTCHADRERDRRARRKAEVA